MPVVTAGLYKVTLKQSLQGQSLLNTYFYTDALGEDDFQEFLANGFDTLYLPLQAPAQTTSLAYLEIAVANVTGLLADVSLTPAVLNGVLAGDPLPSFVSAGIRLVRTTKETRNGQKRFAGGVEIHADGDEWSPGYIAILDAVGTALGGNIVSGGRSYSPVIARQDPITPTNWVVNPVSGTITNRLITSQVSRKHSLGF